MARIMNRTKATVAGLALLGLGAWSLRQCEAAPTAGQGEKMYQGTAPELRVTFSYPEQWPLHEEHGTVESYQAVRIMAPRNSDDTYTSHISVYGAPLKLHGGKFDSAEERVDHYKHHLLSGAEVIAEVQREVGGLQATDLIVSYTIPAIHHKGIKAAAVHITERKIVIASPSYLYEVSYTVDQREYDRYADVFDQLVKSFQVQ